VTMHEADRERPRGARILDPLHSHWGEQVGAETPLRLIDLN